MKLKELLIEVDIPKGTKSAQSGKLNKAADVKELLVIVSRVKNGIEDAATDAGNIAKTKFKVKVTADLKKLADAASVALKANDENGGKDEFFKAWGSAADALIDAVAKKYGSKLNRPAALAFVKAMMD